MTSPTAKSAARARALRRKHLQQRQTVIFGTIIAVLLAVGLFAGAVWADILPSPVTVPIHHPSPTAPTTLPMPCPPPETSPPAYGDISVRVYNSTTTAGLGAQTGRSLEAAGVQVEEIGNADEVYYGSALVTVGLDGIPAAYALAALVPDAQIKVVDREGATADMTIGVAYEGLNSVEEITLDPDLPIPAPDGCYNADEEQLEPDTPPKGSDEESDES